MPAAENVSHDPDAEGPTIVDQEAPFSVQKTAIAKSASEPRLQGHLAEGELVKQLVKQYLGVARAKGEGRIKTSCRGTVQSAWLSTSTETHGGKIRLPARLGGPRVVRG